MSKNLRNKIDLLWQLIKTNFKMRYQNSILGVLWVLIKPYSTFLVLNFVWSKIGRTGTVDNYSLYLLTGIVFYGYFQELIIFGQNSLLERASIILKISFPRQIAVISSLSNAVINLIINSIFIVIIAYALGVPVGILGVFYFLFVTSVVFLLGLGISLFMSIFLIRFRDLKNITELGLFLLYWATPIFYVLVDENIDSITGRFISANPLGVIINQVRAGFGFYGEVDLLLMFGYLGFAIALCLLGWIFFNYHVKKIAEYF
jgi:ABC-type polysaccharide/polyol phosphate export permease